MTGPASTPVERFVSSSMTTWFMLSPVKVTPLNLPAQPHWSSQPQFQRYSIQRWTDRVRDVNSAGRQRCGVQPELASVSRHKRWSEPHALQLLLACVSHPAMELFSLWHNTAISCPAEEPLTAAIPEKPGRALQEQTKPTFFFFFRFFHSGLQVCSPS